MATKRITKAELVSELAAALEAALATARRAHAAALEGATHAEAKPENDKDTRGLEQSYLARGQAQRVVDLETACVQIAAFALPAFGATSPITLGALVTTEDADGRARLFLAPHGGGTVLAGGVQVVTPQSPLGRAVLGRRVDDEVEVRLPGGVRTLAIVEVE